MEDLRSGIEHLKQAKAHMSKANGIMSDHISKLRELEEENERLKDELGALQIQPDASYMKLPVDADGVPIRLGDTVWYIGIDVGIEKDCPMEVNGFVRVPFVLETFIETLECPRKAIASESLTHKRPEPPDSWEKLEEDAMQQSCWYFGLDRPPALCDDCPHSQRQTGRACWQNARRDILARAKKLAGIEEAE